MKKLIALLLSLALTLSLCACGKGTSGSASGQNYNENNEELRQQTIAENGIISMEDLVVDESRKSTANSDERYPYVEFASSLPPKEWQPYGLKDQAKYYARMLIYEFLFDRVGATEYVPRIAKSYTQEDDTNYLIELYDYVTDSAGHPITASDVVFSYDLNAASGYAENFDNYKCSQVVDEFTVRITLNQPITTLDGFFYMFAYTAIVDEDTYDEEAFSRAPVATGPYVLSEFVTDSYCVFEVNEDYWQKEELRSEYAKQNVQTIRIDFVTDASMRMIMLENGSSVCNPYLTAADINSFLKGGEFENQFTLTTTTDSTSTTLLANLSKESIMSDINMRLACWYAINSAALVTALGANAYTECRVDVAGCIGDYQDSWNDIESYQTEYNLEKAKEYLEKAGYKGETIKILAGTFELKKNTAQIVAEMLRQAGINTSIEVVEYVVQEQAVHDPTRWDIYTDSQRDNDFCIGRLNRVYSITAPYAQDGVTKSYIDDPTLQTMLDECSTIEGYSTEKTQEILQYILDNAYGYGGCYTTSYVAWNKVVAEIHCCYGMESTPLFSACEYYLD